MQTFAIVILTFLIIFTFYSRFWFRRVGDWIVQFLQDAFHLGREEALNIYKYGLRENSSLIIFGAVAVLFLLLFRVSLSWFVRYFNEIDAGLDRLIQGDNKEISMSPEMAPMEQKLNVLRQALEKRELEAKLSEERKNNLVMYLAHDIRTPLTSVIGYLSLLEEAKDMPMEQREKYVHVTLEKANRLEQLINEFFEITRYNIQEIILEKEKIDLYYMLVQMLEEFYPALEEKGNRAVLHSSEDVCVYGDSVKLARVFNNILRNAIAYSYRDTQIDIFVEEVYGKNAGDGPAKEKPEKIVVCFRNRGKTIPKEKLSSIFDKFYRMDEARNSDTGGAGLGLAIAKEIVARHGGRIFAESEREQVAFWVELPGEEAEI
ncbi:MAG: HAMP domain-containing histidine kinase [Lachnospiraceae bacterium]|nr:HAMP domain-containing histidine kinase [Lachnospiraceae bacterium]